MKKIIMILIIFGLIIGCASGTDRAEAVKRLGFEIAFQNDIDPGSVKDWFIGIKDKNVYYIKVNESGKVKQIVMIMEMGSCEIIAKPVGTNNQYENEPIIKSDKY